jgi:hypothetical protein
MGPKGFAPKLLLPAVGGMTSQTVRGYPVLDLPLRLGAARFKGDYNNADFGKKLKALKDGKKQE